MFRKYYKAANDDIKTNRELIAQIFNKFEQNKVTEKKSKIYSLGIRYGTAFAAVLVLCVAIAVYPHISKLNEEPVKIESPSIEKEENYTYTTDDVGAAFDLEKANKETTNTPKENTAISHTESDNNNLSIARMAKSDSNEQGENASATIIDYKADFSDLKAMTEDEVQLATNTLTEKLGTADEDTGNIYSFEISGKLETAEKSYYLGRWKWLVDDHLSLICEFVLSDDLNELYECTIYDNTVNWTTNNNMFK